jgi:hypothetical protein
MSTSAAHRESGIMIRAMLVVLLVVSAYAYGAVSHDNRLFPTPQLEAALRQGIWRLREMRGFKDPTGRRQVDCDQFKLPGSAVILTLGQSNAANESTLAYQPGEGVFNFNFFDGKCYVARDPLLGASGQEGSVWSRLGDQLIRAGVYERVLIAPIAVGGTRVHTWTPDGIHFPRIIKVQQALASQGLKATLVLWHQGEADAKHTSKEEYVERFTHMLAGMRRVGIDAPVYVAIASVCAHPGSDAIRDAQREVATTLDNVFVGANTDELDRFRWRRDGCHFSAEGLEEHAKLWAEVLGR